MATKRAPNKENCPPSGYFNFDADDDDFETMSKPFPAQEYAEFHFLGSQNLYYLGQGTE